MEDRVNLEELLEEVILEGMAVHQMTHCKTAGRGHLLKYLVNVSLTSQS